MSRRAFILGLVIVGLLVFSLYRAKYGAKDTAAELMAVEAQIDEAKHEKALLETELSHMSRREWIEEYARNELGMAPPRPEQIADDSDLDALVGKPVDPVEAPDARKTAAEAPE